MHPKGAKYRYVIESPYLPKKSDLIYNMHHFFKKNKKSFLFIPNFMSLLLNIF